MMLAMLWFATPQTAPIDPSQLTVLGADEIPLQGAAPSNTNWQFYLVHTADNALMALFSQAPNGCILKWSVDNYRFEDPCHGYRYTIDGNFIGGGRVHSNMPRFFITVAFTDGTSASTGDPIFTNGREIQTVTVFLDKVIAEGTLGDYWAFITNPAFLVRRNSMRS